MAGAQGTLWEATPRYRALQLALRAMDGFPMLDTNDLAVATAYLRENLTDDQAKRISRTGYSWVNYLQVAQQTWSVDWVEEFLALQDLRAAAKWEAQLVTKAEGTRLVHHGVFDALRALVRSFAGNPRGVPLRDVLPGLDDDTRAAVLKAGFRYLLLFPTLRQEGPEAVVGLSPGAALRLGPPPTPPEPLEPAEGFEAPYLLADMTAVLVELATAPIPLRGDGVLYARARTALAARLQPLPPWIGEILDLARAPDEEDDLDDFDDDEDAGRRGAGPGPELHARAAAAARALVSFGLAATREKGGKGQLAATKEGVRWLQLAEGERLREVLQLFRASGQRNPPGWYDPGKGTEFFPARLGFDVPKASGLDLRAATAAVFLSIPPGAVVSLEHLLRFHTIAANPFQGPGVRKLLEKRYSSSTPTSREEWEILWLNLLRTFLALRLFAYRGARLARTADGVPCVGLTPAGRYLLGATEAFEYAPPPEGEGAGAARLRDRLPGSRSAPGAGGGALRGPDRRGGGRPLPHHPRVGDPRGRAGPRGRRGGGVAGAALAQRGAGQRGPPGARLDGEHAQGEPPSRRPHRMPRRRHRRTGALGCRKARGADHPDRAARHSQREGPGGAREAAPREGDLRFGVTERLASH